jgi:hypothetical protein
MKSQDFYYDSRRGVYIEKSLLLLYASPPKGAYANRDESFSETEFIAMMRFGWASRDFDNLCQQLAVFGLFFLAFPTLARVHADRVKSALQSCRQWGWAVKEINAWLYDKKWS